MTWKRSWAGEEEEEEERGCQVPVRVRDNETIKQSKVIHQQEKERECMPAHHGNEPVKDVIFQVILCETSSIARLHVMTELKPRMPSGHLQVDPDAV